MTFDLARSPEQEQLCDSVRSLLTRECTPERVRRSHDSGYDGALWRQLHELGLIEMSLPSEEEGTGATLLDLALVCELLGEFLVPAPVIETAVAVRLLTRVGGTVAQQLLAAVRDDADPVVMALQPTHQGTVPMVPGGAVATKVLFLEGDALHVTGDEPTGTAIANLGHLCVADRSTAGSTVVAAGPDVAHAVDIAISEWKTLVAALECGVGRRALQLGVSYAKERQAFGVPIATFQTLAHRLADQATVLDGAQLLTWEAAWSHDGDVQRSAQLSSMAYLIAVDAARTTAEDVLHLFGGYGFMLEYDIQLHFRWAKAWGLLLGDFTHESDVLAGLLWEGSAAT
jgi:alkylation response protein AidB-like acyl-CoA dehydrogenase